MFFDDLVTDGKSKLEGMKPLEQHGAQIEMVTVILDREQGGKENLERLDYRFCSLAAISELTKHLLQSGQISLKQFDAVSDYVKRLQK